jgi:hypothetical protein
VRKEEGETETSIDNLKNEAFFHKDLVLLYFSFDYFI